MKNFIIWVMCIILASIVGCNTAKAQNQDIKKEGKVFIATSTRGASNDDVATDYLWRDSKGNEYPLFLHKYNKGEKAGKYTAYVIRKSAKTGKEYKYYIPNGEQIAEQIKRELGI